MKRIVIIGGGFAGLWSAIGAARKLHELRVEGNEVEVVLINRDSFFGVRPRFYEKDPHNYRIPLIQVLEPVGVRLIEGEVGRIDTQSQKIIINQTEKQIELNYDRLVIAAGSQLLLPEITGLKEYAFTVDTIKDAIHLDKHINGLPDLPEVEGKYTTIVVGAGFTGLEIATEMTSRLKEIAKKENKESEVKVILIDRNPTIGQDLGVHPGPIIEQALIDMDIEIHTNETVISIDSKGVILDSGERLVALTTIWTGGVKASPLAADLPVEKDVLGRLLVDSCLKVEGLPSVFAAGDTARAKTDDNHVALMTCQHAIPQGKFAGHNVVSDLLGLEGIPYKQEIYNTCLDLGPWGALVTNGWDRVPQSQGEDGKKIKQYINQKLIYPPLSGNREELFKEAAPTELKIRLS
ncbi:NAD(P)/FAD-dependent oxidoreductase [Paenibacillus sp. FSL H7-0331]|uniref:NAD(P)/FAD-dependent oxidoreductase n=1 Tax=Paenibacillus sp. FSL H7-0331 TaxID=1920421 RepID=UPI00096D5D93|nr:NAD(P)/FAD-dependent oxidoreductase [Paenibacillus sp. FSL H7-0331]OMF05794.1 hypothetical protein BK127_32285 [Paenibacillus sp. FSL H7-0331]